MKSASSTSIELDWAGAASWFAAAPPATTAEAAVRRLAGLAACAIACDDPKIAGAWHHAHAEVNERAAASPAEPFPACDPYLTVFVAAAAARARLGCDGFRATLARLAAQLRTEPTRIRHPRVYAVALMLRALGENVPYDPTQLDAWTPPNLAALFDADDATLANLAHWLTMHGTCKRVKRAIERIGEPPEVADAFVAIAAADCRQYRLTTACDLVRMLQAAGDTSDELTEVRSFLSLQQRADGALGYRNPFVAADTSDDAVRFHLPICLATVSVFAEYRTGRSLIAYVTEALL